MPSLFFYFTLLLFSISNSLGEQNDSFWKMKTSLVLTSDNRLEGVQLCTSIEDELMENAEGSNITSSLDDSLSHSNSLIELIITNQEQEEVTLFVTETVYNLIYRKPDLRKNPNTFHRAQIAENTDLDSVKNVSSGGVESSERVIYIKKHHHSHEGAGQAVPIIQSLNYSHVEFSISSGSGLFSNSNSKNFTNNSENE
ncbi:uncharacterized protein cubi_02896 [Cryptosporidium ubiquitum]|uniref:Uncharacterized protein n=1 Tax=Cryptosporidium ubiquitum TaxID=857276 RepID=A0A1J4MIS7_9CRYT|nr:uncharacterized protein cubi_02896 [Cryptosporidium ubiquitum]OII74094.1 hypothetical protein cubi_02896 [Cryptosporidium ubiquitum]